MDSGVGASSAAGRAKFHLPSARLLFPLRKEPSEVGGHDRPFQLLHPQDFAKSPKNATRTHEFNRINKTDPPSQTASKLSGCKQTKAITSAASFRQQRVLVYELIHNSL